MERADDDWRWGRTDGASLVSAGRGPGAIGIAGGRVEEALVQLFTNMGLGNR